MAGKKIFLGTGGDIFSKSHIPGKDNKPSNANGFPKVSEDNKNIFMGLTFGYCD